MRKHKKELREIRVLITKGEGLRRMASRRDQKKDTPENPSFKLKLSDKIWVAVVIAVFVIMFLLIVIYDVI